MILSLALALASPAMSDAVVVPATALVQSGLTELRAPNGELVLSTTAQVTNARFIQLQGGDVTVAIWNEERDGAFVRRYRLQLGPDKPFSRVRDAQDTVHLRRATFDPLNDRLPNAIDGLEASGEMHIVQFETQPIEAYLNELTDLGATIRNYMPESSRLVQMSGETAALVSELPFVRWVGTYTAADRIDEMIRDEVADGSLQPTRVHIQVMESGPAMKAAVAGHVTELGGKVEWMIDEGFRFDATLSAAQIKQVAALDNVLWIDVWGAPEEDMDKVRIDGGANYVEVAGGFTGTGVRGEAMDGNCDATHPDLQSNPVIFHGGNGGSATHGTPVTGVVFGDGAGLASRRGLLPDAQPIFADYGNLNNRYTHTAQLVQAPYNAVFQTNSWGGPRTTVYNSTSMEMDDILFQNDIVILQSQSNAGDPQSRPQAWAKNIVSVGGIRHQNTQTLNDDSHNGGAGSTGPAADGRLKPDLSYWYDSILAPQAGGGSTQFGGTSAATPMTAGFFGIFFQMWHEGIFGNTTAATVFDSAPKATLTRAFMINTAARYDFSPGNNDLRRVRQGWGRANVASLYDNRDNVYFVNEEEVLAETESISYLATVDPGTSELAITMVYLDRAGTTSASLHRINDLSLRVTAPNGSTEYWGNNGLNVTNESTPGGVSNTKDPIENVFITNPTPGDWLVEIFADDINQDTHVETPALDADFSLVMRGVSGVGGNPCPPPVIYCEGAPNSVAASGANVTPLGSTSIAANDMILFGDSFPAQTFTLVSRSMVQASQPLGNGTLCIGNPLYRLSITQADFLGQVAFPIDTNEVVQGSQVMPGESWNYQFWYRDGASSNLSDAVNIVWCP